LEPQARAAVRAGARLLLYFEEEPGRCDGRSLPAVSIAVAPPAMMITMIVMQRHIPAFR
jgi:hypothetical protein